MEHNNDTNVSAITKQVEKHKSQKMETRKKWKWKKMETFYRSSTTNSHK